jgi:hypothetical protein
MTVERMHHKYHSLSHRGTQAATLSHAQIADGIIHKLFDTEGSKL